MAEGPAAPDPKPPVETLHPPLVLRIGVTGHLPRDIPPEVQPGLETAIRDVLQEIEDSVKAIHRRIEETPDLAGIYAAVPPLVRLLTPLAEGTDRMSARAALALGWKLWAILPFPRTIYERDFVRTPGSPATDNGEDNGTAVAVPAGVPTDTRAEFAALLARAGDAVLEMDGTHETPQPAPWSWSALSYLAAGKLLIRHSDLMVAVWNGRPGRGPGGTGDIVERTLQASVPVLWIDATAAERRCWVASGSELAALAQAGLASDGRPAASPQAWRADLRAYLERLLLPPSASALGRIPRLARKRWLAWTGLGGLPLLHGQPLRYYLERARHAELTDRSRFSRIFDVVSGTAMRLRPMRHPAEHGAGIARATSRIADRLYHQPIALAGNMGGLYRSAFTSIILLGLVAVLFAILGLAWHHHPGWLGLIELAALIGILLVYAVSRTWHWHDRWIDYRLLTELGRSAVLGMQLGRPLARRMVFALAGSSARSNEAKRQWVAWLFDAYVRAAPPLRAVFDQAYLDGVKQQLLAVSRDQADYHLSRHHRSESIAHNLGWAGTLLFFGSLIAVALGIVLHSTVLATLSAAFPGIAAALFAFRAQGEFEVIAKTSEHMHVAHERLGRRIAAIATGRPMASAELGDGAADLMRVMLADVQGWAVLFDVKEVEAGG